MGAVLSKFPDPLCGSRRRSCVRAPSPIVQTPPPAPSAQAPPPAPPVQTLPPRPSSVCQECWEGPFAMQFGLPYRSLCPDEPMEDVPGRGYWCSTSWAKLESRSTEGCVWCRFMLVILREEAEYYQRDDPIEIKVFGDTDADMNNAQRVKLMAFRKHLFDPVILFEGYIHTTADDPVAPNILLRSPILDVGSTRAMDLARNDIEDCAREHGGECKALWALPDPLLPTRLVDCHDPAKPRLVSTAGQRGRYLALSYAWGEDQPYKTTTARVLEYEQGINVSLLPKTIQDAIRITHALKFKYLWADTLCIIQDSQQDKLHELERMHHIYQYAFLTIIASSAAKVSEGFLHDRPPPPQIDSGDHQHDGKPTFQVPFIRYTPSVPSETDFANRTASAQVGTVSISTKSLSAEFCQPALLPGRGSSWSWPFSYSYNQGQTTKRGWCMQEDLLSARALIFDPMRLQFRCPTSIQGVGSPASRTYNTMQIPSLCFLGDPSALPPADFMQTIWRDLVSDYSGRAISDPLDKLVACAAIAEHFHRVFNTDYLAGMWLNTLVSDLLWLKHPSALGTAIHRPAEKNAPSWSWAAVDWKVHWSSGSDMTWEEENFEVAEVVRCKVTPLYPRLPFGRVKDGILVLRAAFFQCQLSPEALHPDPSGDKSSTHGTYRMVLQSVQRPWRQTGDSKREANLNGDEAVGAEGTLCGDAEVDYDADDGAGRIEKLWAIPIQRDIWSDLDGRDIGRMSGLVVARALAPQLEVGEPVYRRVGTFKSLLYRPERGRRTQLSHQESENFIRALKERQYPMVDITLV
ncbi:hypothetical protein TRAPUB_9139 [Trametes pubescens]|uniref:Heterokaryon incompatibility domain-containing protein n=1 Tax=Trametes pubescens TaxID=154538 RepID=A0A1M2W360_TRAPU|nr:hypothetical protein TRAPUB_9139 [Trametes pubescens]